MEDDWLDQIDEDFKTLPELKILEDARVREHVMRAVLVLFLKIWMRFALDIGLKMSFSPSSEEVAMYKGRNDWVLSNDFNFSALDEISITNQDTKLHSLKAQTYASRGRDHVRIIFSLEEERIQDQPVMVNYVVYSSLAKDFSIEDTVKLLKPGLGKWFLALADGELSILWNYCKEKYELVGV